MKMFFYSFVLLVFTACSNALDHTNNNYLDADILKTNESGLKVEADIISFETSSSFKEAVEKLSESQSSNQLSKSTNSYENILIYNDMKIEDFHSLYDDYMEAMYNAENYYDREGGYDEFKEKYSMLYFPEYEDDYSAYLPVSNKHVAKLLNSEGNVKINGEIINMKDIFSYQKLVELGETMSQNEISTKDYVGNYLNGTPELINGGDRKLKVRVYTEPGSSGVLEAIVVDVSFRKKGAFGAWYNYKSNTTLAWVPGASWSKEGFSSHDYKFARVYQNGASVPFKGRMYVEFQGFRGEKVYFDVNI